MMRSAMYSDSITAKAAEFVKMMESERGSLLTAQAPIGLVVVDVLRAIGLPENALAMVVGHERELFDEAFGDKTHNLDRNTLAKCAFCEDIATAMVDSPRGKVYACLKHASAAGVGSPVIYFPGK